MVEMQSETITNVFDSSKCATFFVGNWGASHAALMRIDATIRLASLFVTLD